MSLVALYSSPDLDLILDQDDGDVEVVSRVDDVDLVYPRVQGASISLKRAADFNIEVQFDGLLPRTILTRSLLAGTHVLAFPTNRRWKLASTHITRATPAPTLPGSVGAGTHEDASTSSGFTTCTSGSFTPSNAFLLVWVVGKHSGGGGPDDVSSISDTFSDTITWTKIDTQIGGSKVSGSLWRGEGWSSGAGTVTATFGNTQDNIRLIIDSYSGVDGSPVISESAKNLDTTGAFTVNLGGIGSSNRSHAGVGTQSPPASITAGSNETEVGPYGTTGSGGAHVGSQTQHGTSNGQDTGCNWSSLGTVDNVGVAAELAAAAALGDDEIAVATSPVATPGPTPNPIMVPR